MASKVRQTKYFYEMIVFLIITLFSTISASTTGGASNIAIWHDAVISTQTKHQLDNLLRKLNKKYHSSFTLSTFSLNFSATEAHDFFHSMQNFSRDDVRYVVTTLGRKNTWLWSKLLSNKETMFIDIHNPGHEGEIHDHQLLLTNFLKLVPPASEKRVLLDKMAREMLCRKTITLTCPSSWNEVEILQKQMQRAAAEMILCIVLECSFHLDRIFSLAEKHGVLGRRYRWLSVCYFEQFGKFKSLPRNLISIDLSKVGKPEEHSRLNLDLVGDALTFFAEVNKTSGHRLSRYPIQREFLKARFLGKTGFVYFSSGDHIRHGTNYNVYQLVSLVNMTGWLRIGMWENNSFDTSLMMWITNEVSRVVPPLLRIATLRSEPWMFYATDQTFDEETLDCVVGMKCVKYTSYISEANNTFVEHCCTGMLVELLQELMKRIQFTPRLHFTKDTKFGGEDPITRQWNGMIGEVLRNEADTALYSLTITASRAKVVQFSYPFIAAGSGILVSVDKSIYYPILNHSFLSPFSRDLWFFTLAVLAVTVVTLWVAERFNQRRTYNTFLDNRNKLRIYTFVESLTYGWGVFVQKVVQEGGPRTLGGRVVVATLGFYMIIILSSYTANLAAIKVVEDEKAEIADIYDDKFIHPTDAFKFTSSKFTATSDFFRLSPDKRLNDIYHVMKDRLVRTRAKALEQLKSGEIQAFFEDTPSLHYMASQQENCDLKVVGKSFGNSGYGMPFRRNSSWKIPISNALREMHEAGVITKLSQKWLEGTCVTKKSVNVAMALGIRDESGILFLLAVFCFGSFVLLAFEYLFKKVFSKFFYTHTLSSSYNFAAALRRD